MEAIYDYKVLANDDKGREVVNHGINARSIKEAIEQCIEMAADYYDITISVKDMWGRWKTAAEIWPDGTYVIY